MRKIATFIVDKRRLFIILFLIAAVLSVFTSQLVNVRSELYDFLPEYTDTRQGLDAMNGEFTTFATAKVMLDGINYNAAVDICHELEEIDGVRSVSFDDSSLHFTDNAALYDITFAGEAQDKVSVDALADVEHAVRDEKAYIDTDVGVDIVSRLGHRMLVVGAVVVAIVIVLLTITSRSYAEVPVLLLTFGAAALLQFGTNFIFKSISFISNAVTLVLQLALAIDYAVILCNRFAEEKQYYAPREATIEALSKAIPEIFSSSLTTIGGLIAMTFMQFGLGADLGRVLIKSILLSMLSVFLLMPGLLVAFNGAIERTKHHNFIPRIDGVGRFAWRMRKVIPPVFAVLLVIFAYCSFNCPFSYNYSDAMPIKLTDTQVAHQRIKDTFGYSNMMAVIVPTGDYETEAMMLDEIAEQDHVTSVLGIASVEAVDGYRLIDKITIDEFSELAGLDEISSKALFAYYGAAHSDYREVTDDLHNYEIQLMDLFMFLYNVVERGDIDVPQDKQEMIEDLYTQLLDAKKQLQGRNYNRMLVYCDTQVQSEESYELATLVHDIARSYYGEDVYMAGDVTCTRDLENTYTTDNAMVSILSAVFVILVILFIFRSAGLAVLLIAVIQGSIWLNFTVPYVTQNSLFFVGYLIVTAIQMGANIDYAIVISNRYITLRQNNSKRASITGALNGGLPTLITSGSILALAGVLIGYMSTEATISAIGIALGRGTFISLLLVLFVLPALLLWGDGLIKKTSFAQKTSFRVPPIFKEDFDDVARRKSKNT